MVVSSVPLPVSVDENKYSIKPLAGGLGWGKKLLLVSWDANRLDLGQKGKPTDQDLFLKIIGDDRSCWSLRTEWP